MSEAFTQVPMSVITDKELSFSAKVLLAFILGRTNKTGYCWASNVTIAEELSVTVRKITKDLTELEKGGYIKRFFDKEGRRIYPQVKITKIEQPFKTSLEHKRKPIEQKRKLPMNSRSSNNITSSSKEEEVIIQHNNSSYVVSSSLQEETPKANSADVYGTEHFQEAYRFSKKDYEGTIFGVKWGGKMPQEKMTEHDFVNWATNVQNFILEKIS